MFLESPQQGLSKHTPTIKWRLKFFGHLGRHGGVMIFFGK
jgi:hypothetical protein